MRAVKTFPKMWKGAVSLDYIIRGPIEILNQNVQNKDFLIYPTLLFFYFSYLVISYLYMYACYLGSK